MSRSVLALRALGLGDLLTGVPALRALERARPGARLLLATSEWLRPLVPLVGPWEVVPARPLEPLPALRPDLAVNLHGRGPESTRALETAHPARLVCFGRDGREWREREHEVLRWCRLLEESGIPADPGDLDLAPPPAEPPTPARGATLIHVGASSGARRWPVERWAEVAKRVGPAVVTAGLGEAELALDLAVMAGLPPERLFIGRPLEELAALVSTCSRVLSADTGVAHLATAYRRPSVVLFGPTSPEVWGPPPGRPQHRVLWSGRLGDPHAEETHPGLLEITPEQVLRALAA